ncbi:hypothetical protein FWG95_01080 [Candidatus Saccharibacteria bacterium]|nr:hypothetical protein [Candidatus Saccharibacteria bacterium]
MNNDDPLVPSNEAPNQNFDTGAKVFAPPTNDQVINATKVSAEATPVQDPNSTQAFTPLANVKNPAATPAAQTGTIVFGVISACYFGYLTIMNIMYLAVGTFLTAIFGGGLFGWVGFGTLLNIIVIILIAILCWASIQVARFKEKGRVTWLRISIVLIGLVLLQAGISVGIDYKYGSGPNLVSILATLIPSAALLTTGLLLLTRRGVRAWFS